MATVIAKALLSLLKGPKGAKSFYQKSPVTGKIKKYYASQYRDTGGLPTGFTSKQLAEKEKTLSFIKKAVDKDPSLKSRSGKKLSDMIY